MNILTVNLLFSTVVFAIAAKLYLIPMLPRLEPRSVRGSRDRRADASLAFAFLGTRTRRHANDA